ncbi:MAG: hypothetical protein C4520_07175 [Candidatus Abyssobacteria bacterium SURF_5]|uniref:Glycosyl hydrolase family 4 C-terminal domain-containing protein n=1 Tax=Abyssobacteria bacterium (strain SURF_5) TaxID=2093360 RepID=A0A3A4P0Z6_ABYX5|nr:MAG: hypothetical protein C4520_07175 [Candidatus Abyssubacteria bacterium SURF_5]
MTPLLGKKIVFLGGGSTQFAPLLISDFIKTKDVYGSTIVLVDVNEEKLKLVYQLGRRLIETTGAALKLEYTTDRVSALPGADFVIISVEVNRFPLWHMDRRIPKKFGIEQAQGENGGPGGLFHAMRQIPLVVEICQDVERLCPEAMVINLANPMSRILQAVNDYTNVRFIGSCHEIVDGNGYLSALLEVPEDRLHVVAAGLNHFTWYLDIRDKQTGEDLYPMVRELAPTRVHMDRLLVADLFRLSGYLCVTSDSHIGEYIPGGHIWRTPWASDLEPFDFFSVYQIYLKDTDERVQNAVAGKYPLQEFMQWPSGEIVAEIISALAHDRKQRFNALNLPNDGYISNLPPNSIVEVPGWTRGGQTEGEPVGSLPPLISGWCHLQTTIHYLNAKAAMEGSRQAALEAMLLDPAVPDRFTAERCLDAMLEANREYLPRFFS